MNKRDVIREYQLGLARKGGIARAKALSPERRIAIAKLAAKASAKVRRTRSLARRTESPTP